LTRPSADQLKQAHIFVEPLEARAAALERSLFAQRLETELASRNKVVSRFAGCLPPSHPLNDTSSPQYAHQCHQAETLRATERAQVAATVEKKLATRRSLKELKKAHIFVEPVEARAAALQRTMSAQRLEKDLARKRVSPLHAGHACADLNSAALQQDSGSIEVDSMSTKHHAQFKEPNTPWLSLAGFHASPEVLQRYETCFASLLAMGFQESEGLRPAVVMHNGDIDAVLEQILG
jgi:hypothetical protein